MAEQANQHFVIALTGASGSIYGIRLIKVLLEKGAQISFLLTEAGRQVLHHEMGVAWAAERTIRQDEVRDYFGADTIDCLDVEDIGATIASGSAAVTAMVIVPCSMGTAGRIAAGLSGNLLERAADVMLKEKRPLIVVPRETPLNSIHLENLLRLDRAGAVILPAMPGFYHLPDSLESLVDFVVGKIMDQLGLSHELFPGWKAVQN